MTEASADSAETVSMAQQAFKVIAQSHNESDDCLLKKRGLTIVTMPEEFVL